jgi:HEPN domain-containing protein
MNDEDVKEWMTIADNDFDSAKLLNEAIRRHFEIICYLCAQAVEKYLKGYLMYKGIIPEKTHNLSYLNRICAEHDNNFLNITPKCDFLNQFANDIRYPHRYEVTESDVNFSIDAVEKIRNIQQIADLRNSMDM